MDITSLREQINDIDRELTELFIKRMTVSAAIGAYKKEHGLPVHVPQREQEIIDTVSQNTPAVLTPYVTRLYAHIFALSREYQEEAL